jgi:hypothetical protein
LKYLGKIAVLGAVLALSASSAFADPVSGNLTIFGFDSYSATGITFTTPSTISAASGSLTSYQGAQVGLTSFSWATADGTELFFSPTVAPTLTFTINGPVDVVSDTSTFLNVTGNGTFIEAGFSPTVGTFSLTSTANGNVSFTLDTTASATPEPNSLMLMGTGLVSAAGMVLRRRRTVA